MGNKVVVYKHRTNRLPVKLGFDITGDTITSQIRVEEDPTSTLIATWTVTVTDAATGELLLTIDDTVAAGIAVDSGFMDIKRVSGGEPLPVFAKPVEVTFQGAVTA